MDTLTYFMRVRDACLHMVGQNQLCVLLNKMWDTMSAKLHCIRHCTTGYICRIRWCYFLCRTHCTTDYIYIYNACVCDIVYLFSWYHTQPLSTKPMKLGKAQALSWLTFLVKRCKIANIAVILVERAFRRVGTCSKPFLQSLISKFTFT